MIFIKEACGQLPFSDWRMASSRRDRLNVARREVPGVAPRLNSPGTRSLKVTAGKVCLVLARQPSSAFKDIADEFEFEDDW